MEKQRGRLIKGHFFTFADFRLEGRRQECPFLEFFKSFLPIKGKGKKNGAEKVELHCFWIGRFSAGFF